MSQKRSLSVPRAETPQSWISVDFHAKSWDVYPRDIRGGDAGSRMNFPPLESAGWMDTQGHFRKVGRGMGFCERNADRSVCEDTALETSLPAPQGVGGVICARMEGITRDGDCGSNEWWRRQRLIRRSHPPSSMPVSLSARLACRGCRDTDEPRGRC